MPPSHEPKQKPQKTLEELADDIGLYPPEAFDFLEQGLRFTVTHVHGAEKAKDPDVNRHVSGQQLCEGLREVALRRWGMLARTVLGRWNISSTLDFGRIVFGLISAGQMQKTDDDTLDDFRGVYDFKTVFETSYQIPAES